MKPNWEMTEADVEACLKATTWYPAGNLARSMVGHIRGGLAIVCVITSCFFAAISGSGPATVAALGAIIIPAMVEQGYRDSDSSALMSVSGTIGLIIPPSILFVVYGSITGVSISKLLSLIHIWD